MTGAGEVALWKQSLAGHPRAFSALFELHRDAVYRQAYRVTGRHEKTEEVSAIAFLELWRLRTRVRLVHGSVLPWLVVTTLNTARNTSRSAHRYRGLLARLPASEPAAETDLGDGVWEGLDRTQGVSDALGRLPHRDRALAGLVFIAEVPIPDAAAVLSMTERTARNRVTLIRKRLRVDLVDLNPAPAGPASQPPTLILRTRGDAPTG